MDAVLDLQMLRLQVLDDACVVSAVSCPSYVSCESQRSTGPQPSIQL